MTYLSICFINSGKKIQTKEDKRNWTGLREIEVKLTELTWNNKYWTELNLTKLN